LGPQKVQQPEISAGEPDDRRHGFFLQRLAHGNGGRLTKSELATLFLAVRTLSAIVLLLWAVCYGRCLAEQYGVHETTVLEQTWGAPECCHQEKPDVPSPASSDVCVFITSGSTLPGGQLLLDVPVFSCLPVPESDWFTASTVVMLEPTPILENTNTGPPKVLRLCEWMASTAAPVRGPNLCA
jgi:hypothetical protein